MLLVLGTSGIEDSFPPLYGGNRGTYLLIGLVWNPGTRHKGAYFTQQGRPDLQALPVSPSP